MDRPSITGRRVAAALAVAIVALAPSLSAFKTRHHVDVTTEVLLEVTRTIDGHTLRFSPWAIQEIVRANINQDNGIKRCGLGFSPGGAFAVSANHFDSEKLLEGSQQVKARLDEATTELMRETPQGTTARRLLGQALHGVQDYYAHSNWVETQPGIDTRLGSGIIQSVGPNVQTCEAPPSTGTYLNFSGLTSGYWFGCFGEDSSQLPRASAITACRACCFPTTPERPKTMTTLRIHYSSPPPAHGRKKRRWRSSISSLTRTASREI